jgi:steroid delta-isomerase-like uncharacterized protein
MSVQGNKEIVRRWNEEVINNGNLDVIDELAAENYINHNGGLDRAAHKQQMARMGAAFSDGEIVLEETVAEGDMVSVRWRMRGTHTGEYMGVPATGKQIVTPGMSMYRIAGGKIAEDWSVMDMLGVMQQLGLVPST